MASPPVTSPPHKALDPSKKANFTLRLSDRVSKSGGAARKGLTSVKLNYKPSSKGDNRTTTITSSAGTAARLSIEDKSRHGKFSYTGQRSSAKRSYVLVFDADAHTATLEPVTAAYAFNLKSTPYETNEAVLENKYPQIDLRKDDNVESAAQADAERNPYDFRNFLAADSPSPPLTSAAATPVLPVKRAPKPQAPVRKSTNTKPKPKPKRTASPPSINLDRSPSPPSPVESPAESAPASSPTSSPAPAESPSPIGFEIDYGDSMPSSKPRGLGLHLTPSNGPISLRSAANSASPSSRLATPHQHNPPDEDDVDFEFDFADTRVRRAEESDEDAEGEDDEDEDDESERDVDVEPMDLGPPASQPPHPAPAAIGAEGDDEEFERIMMAELEQSEDPVEAEEESESEEE